MKCEEARSLLDLYLDHQLPAELTVRLDRHLLRCSQCAGDLRSLEQACNLLRLEAERAEASPSFRERTAARLQDRLAAHLKPAPETGARPIRRFSSTVRRLKISRPCGTKPMPSAARR